MDLLLIRHGKCGTDSTDDALTTLGEWQAWRIGQRLAEMQITALLSSPLIRALGTAHIVAQILRDRSVEVWPELREGLYGTLQSYGRAELAKRFPLAMLPPDIDEQHWHHDSDTQETMFTRCQQFLSKLHERFEPQDTIVAFAHGGIITYLLHVILQISPEMPVWFEMDYGAISRVRFLTKEQRNAYPPLYPEMAMEVLRINDVSHLL